MTTARRKCLIKDHFISRPHCEAAPNTTSRSGPWAEGSYSLLSHWMCITQPAGCQDTLGITVGLSLGKSLPLNSFTLGQMEAMLVLSRLFPLDGAESVPSGHPSHSAISR